MIDHAWTGSEDVDDAWDCCACGCTFDGNDTQYGYSSSQPERYCRECWLEEGEV